jgi:hypothetical protein
MMRRLITYFGLDGLPHELNTGRCERLPISRSRDAYGCLIVETLYTCTAPDGKQLRVRHTYWEAPPHEVALHSDTGISPVNERAEEIPEEEYDRIRPDIAPRQPEVPVGVLPNDARDRWMTEQWLAGKTSKEIHTLLAQHPEWGQYAEERSVHGAITRYADKHGITLPERKQKRKPDLRLISEDSAEGR